MRDQANRSYQASCQIPASPKAVTRAIILAGQEDAPLYPLTQVVPRELLPVYNKPMIYYPISALMLAGIREMLLVAPLRKLRAFMELLGNGSRLGISLSYEDSPFHKADAEIFLSAEGFIDGDPVALAYGSTILLALQPSSPPFQSREGASVFVTRGTPSAQHPLVESSDDGTIVSLSECSRNSKNGQIAAGIFVYDRQVLPIVNTLLASGHAGRTILDINREYLWQGRLYARKMPREVTRLDGGNASDCLKASNLVARFERRNPCKVGCPEEAAFRMGYISTERLQRLACDLPEGDYREFLLRLAASEGRKWQGVSACESARGVLACTHST